MTASTLPEGFRRAYRTSEESQLAGLEQLARIAEEQASGSLAALPAPPRRVRRTSHITVLIPAHNEAATIATTIRSLREQTIPIASITVVCDNCTDDTARIAGSLGVNVMETAGNKARKAGP
jgi:hypothetical protein